jgi:phenylacetate-CoA ligase
VHIKVEHHSDAADAAGLKAAIEARLRDKLIFRADIELVPPNALPRYEYKAQLVKKLYA